MWPRVMITRWIVTPDLDSTLNYDPGLNSTSNCDPEYECGVIIQHGNLSRVTTLNFDLRLQSNLDFWSVQKVSKFNSVINFQQLKRVTIQRKIHLILTTGRYEIEGGGFKNFIFHRHTLFTFLTIPWLTKCVWIKYSSFPTRVSWSCPLRDESRNRSKKSPFFDKVLLPLWNLQKKKNKCLIID